MPILSFTTQCRRWQCETQPRSPVRSRSFALDQIPDTIQKIAITMVIDGSDTISGLAQLKLLLKVRPPFCRSQWPHRKGSNYGGSLPIRATGSSGRLGRDLMAGLSHWQLAMVWTWNLQQKLYRNQPGSALKRNSGKAPALISC